MLVGISAAHKEQCDGDWSFKLVTCRWLRSETGNTGSGDIVVHRGEPMSFGRGTSDNESHE
ncbi:hypothetical protein [Halioxenophilus aromaticivorans]|uniref:Uncharacterized protein n=1 Tax=Halioxenophilus aromaticivorans TaxID=1306992 RepID=A0AAV3TWG9_9ALTE